VKVKQKPRNLLILALVSAGLAQTSSAHAAEPYPTRPVRMLVPFAPGGGIDFLARVTAQELSDRLGRQFVIENQTGGGGAIASYTLANAKPDGYTIIFQSSSSAAVVPAVSKNLRYDPIKDFAPVSLVGALPLVLVVNKDLPVTDLQSFVELLRKNPGKHSYGTAGPATAIHLVTELFRLGTNTQIQHVPYRGMNPATQDVLAGNISMVIDAVPAQLGNINGGTIRALAVTANKRSGVLPGVPTMQESGLKDFDFLFWGAIYAPAGTPDEIVQKLSTTIGEIMRDEKVGKRLRDVGNEPIGSSPAELDKYWKSEIDLYRKIVTDAGIKLEQ
jgi:tripartite-type tricarboxylate transporter receptor subunit TctC